MYFIEKQPKEIDLSHKVTYNISCTCISRIIITEDFFLHFHFFFMKPILLCVKLINDNIFIFAILDTDDL